MQAFVLTDLEGIAGLDSFRYTRTADPDQKLDAMKQLSHEANAAVAGTRDAAPDAEVTVWDGHGSGGLRGEDVTDDATFLDDGRPYYDLAGYDAVLFVGQHAMAGTVDAPLRHTYSSRNVAYYKLNGSYVGEFACRALVAGHQGVPTVFLSGDDKACREAEMFIPEIETVATKQGTGEEAADHLDPEVACERIREGATRAMNRLDEFEPYTRYHPPYELEIRYLDPLPAEGEGWWRENAIERVDAHTIRIEGDVDLADPPEEFYIAL